jgi:hypothetical protein
VFIVGHPGFVELRPRDFVGRRRSAIEQVPRSAILAPTHAAAVPFMIAITGVDLALEFPRDLNVPFPEALLFYPAMGYVGQITLHLFPFAILLPLMNRVGRSWPAERMTYYAYWHGVWGQLRLRWLF